MQDQSKELLHCCLYFTANALARSITRMAEEEFGKQGLTPSHAFLLMLAIDSPGISQKELSEQLNLAQSTVSRFVDALVSRGFISKNAVGKIAHIFPTEAGKAQMENIRSAWNNLYYRYSDILGEEEGKELTIITKKAHLKLEE